MNAVKIIAEIGSTHDGSFGNAKCLIKEAAACGVDMVKFQTHFAEHETLKDAPSPSYFKDESRYDYFKRISFDKGQYEKLKVYAEKECKVEFLSSPFSLEAVDFLKELNVNYLKIPSGEITNLPMIEKVARSGGKIILSSGMSSWAELEAAVNVLRRNGNNDICIMQCTSEYPCLPEHAGLNVIKEIRERYHTETGFSDHTYGCAAAVGAVVLGATMIEKHFTLSKLMYGSDARYSLEPSEMRRFVQEIRDAYKAVTHKIDKNAFARKLEETKQVFEKSIVFSKALVKGSVISLDDLAFKKPGTGISASMYRDLIGKRLKQDVVKDQKAEWNMVE